MLFMNSTADQVFASIMINTDDGYLQQYVDHYVNECPWRTEIATKPKGRIYSSSLDCSCGQKEFHNSLFYQDWARPQEIEHGMGGTIVSSGDTTIQFTIQRSAQPGHFTREETNYLDTLVPHLRQSLELNQQLEANRLLTQAFSQASQISPLPFVLLDEQIKICHMSTQAEEILSSHPLLSIQKQRIVCSSPSAQNKLQRMLLKSSRAEKESTWSVSGGQLTLSSQAGEELELLCYPLHEQFSSTQATRQAFTAVFLNLRGWYRFDRLRLKTAYSLTDAEILVAEALFNGQSLQDYSTLRGTSFHTVRTQCKTLMKKLAISRQAALNPILLPYISR
jgi:DNA-binding CsgD family transcriptional regulator